MTNEWYSGLLLDGALTEGAKGEPARMKWSGGVLRDATIVDERQAQTRDIFAFKWSKQETYQSEAMQSAIAEWLKSRYGDLITRAGDGSGLTFLDAGCGAGNAADLLLSDRWKDVNYVGVDISSAVDIARERIMPKARRSLFLQADLQNLPLRPDTFDIVFSEGVLHHTPSTERGFLNLARLVKPGGIIAIYVYAKKAPIREFSDDYVRELVADLPGEEAWERLIPLSRLGKALGDLDVTVNVPEPVEVLGIPAGPINVQRLFYYYVCKMFYRSDLTIEEMNHVNFDWFMPKYCSRHTPEELVGWCGDAGLIVEDIKPEESGITLIARKPAARS